MKHPNATASGVSSAAGIVVIAALGAAGYDLSPEVAGAVVGLASGLALLVGRSGLRGLARLVWRGNGEES